MRFTGPYLDKATGRQFIKIIKDDGTKTSQIYARYLLEQKLGRKLEWNEEADHIDRNKTNDDSSNLQVKLKRDHIKEDIKRVKLVILHCIFCNKELKPRSPSRIRQEAKRYAGPFCHSCASTYGANRKNYDIEELPKQKTVSSEYYQLPKVSSSAPIK